MIDQVIDLINNGFGGLHKDEIIFGLAQRVYRVNREEVIEYMPGIVNAEGEAIYAGIDDVKSLMVYHKANTANLRHIPRSGYGDGLHSEDNITSSVIAVWDTRKIMLHGVDMMLLLRSRMPQAINGVNEYINANIIPSSALFDTKQIFDTEYQLNKNYLLPMYINFIQLNYTIQIKYDQRCIEKCINCST